MRDNRGWADHLKLGLEQEIKAIDIKVKKSCRIAAPIATLEENLAARNSTHLKESAASCAERCTPARMRLRKSAMRQSIR